MTTTDGLPMRPRGAARDAANATAAATAAATADAAATDAAPATAAPGTATEAGAGPLPTRRARRAAVTTAAPDGVTPRTTGSAVSPPAAPVSTAPDPTTRPLPVVSKDAGRASGPVTAPLPSRRTLRRVHRTTAASGMRAVTQAVTLPLRTIGSAVGSAKAVPVTATAVAACLFVSVATPQPAMADTPQVTQGSVEGQDYAVAAGAATISVQRDAFAIGVVPIRKPASPPPSTSGGPTSVRPVAGDVPTAGGFGSRWVRGCGACSTDHKGLDFAAPTGTDVVAAMSGRVVSAGVFGGYGNQVLLQHADGSQTRYGHLSRIGVRVGQTVRAGELIGAVGSTGVSTGAHLHFEVIVGGTPVDPAAWLQHRGLL